jgi:hypothetical protein
MDDRDGDRRGPILTAIVQPAKVPLHRLAWSALPLRPADRADRGRHTCRHTFSGPEKLNWIKASHL